ncbi:MAG: ribosome small subunit-dependent GTPase A [Clostridium sp.]|jgi:ribosome biogenesis GTPase|nr:ribosome small subunit-dependent GTPase A [Clostridium sp.]
MQGKIVKGIAGVYYVSAGGSRYECKARGIFRKEHRKPLVGDEVRLDVLDEEERLGNIRELLPRRSELIRPAVANVDQALILFSLVRPRPSFNLLDRFLIMMKQQGLPCIICFNKQDLDKGGEGESCCQVYAGSGCPVLVISTFSGTGMEELQPLLEGKTTAVAGPSGAGKSSLINSLQSAVVMQTGGLSAKIERGKHTTRHSEIIAIRENTYLLDTPGFSALGIFSMEKEDLSRFYPELDAYEKECRFGGCSHIGEPQCGVKAAVAAGKIHPVRYRNYCLLYEELKNRKKYECFR